MKDYPIDIAISLCHEDLDYAKKLHKALNPKLKVFLYSERQAELLTTSGLVEFAKKFRQESRLVVILYRDRWGKSGMTEIEQEAIWERSKKTEQGYDFIVMVPLEGREVPVWYPKSRIYANPTEKSVEEIAGLIEYQFAQREGVVEPLTLEDKITNFKQKQKERIDHVRFLQSKESGPAALKELESFINLVNQRIEVIRSSEVGVRISYKEFNENAINGHGHETAEVSLDNHMVKFLIRHAQVVNFMETSLAFSLAIERYSSAGSSAGPKYWQPDASQAFMFNTDGAHLTGWSVMRKASPAEARGRTQFYFNTTEIYDLGDIIPSAELVEKQFIWLFEQMETGYKNLLNL